MPAGRLSRRPPKSAGRRFEHLYLLGVAVLPAVAAAVLVLLWVLVLFDVLVLFLAGAVVLADVPAGEAALEA